MVVTMTFRAFISVDLPGDARMKDLVGSLHLADRTLKTVDPSLMHVTLKFLGDTDESKIGGVLEAMKAAAQGIAPFEIVLKGVGAFPNVGRARVVWVGMENAAPLSSMAQRLEGSLESLDFPPERRAFAPHLTVARARAERSVPAVRKIIEENATTELGHASVDRIRLKRSVLTPSGPQYSTVDEVLLSP